MVLIESSTDYILEWFLSHCYINEYLPKSTIIYQGKKSKTLFYIIKGIVKVIIKNNEGKEIILSYLNSGDFIGELGFFKKNKNSSAWVNTKNKCLVAEISYVKFNKIIEINSEIIIKISKQIACRLQVTSEKIRNLAFSDVTERIVQTLFILSKQYDAITHPQGRQIKITRQEIGQIVGCSRETVGRVFKILQNQNIISAHGKNILIYGAK